MGSSGHGTVIVTLFLPFQHRAHGCFAMFHRSCSIANRAQGVCHAEREVGEEIVLPRFRYISIKPCKDYPDVGSLLRMARMAATRERCCQRLSPLWGKALLSRVGEGERHGLS